MFNEGKEKPLMRLKRKTTVENLWIYILKLLSEKPMYAYQLNRDIRDRFGFEIGSVSAYIILYKLKNSGYVDIEWRNEGRPRKYYRITGSGRRLLKEGRAYMKKLIKMLE